MEGVRNLNGAIQYGWEIAALLYTAGNPAVALGGGRADRSGRGNAVRAARKADGGAEREDRYLRAASRCPYARRRACSPPDAKNAAAGPVRPTLQQGEPGYDHPFLRFYRRGRLDSHRPCGGICTIPRSSRRPWARFFRVPVIRVPDTERVMRWMEDMRERFPAFQTVGTTAHRETEISAVDLCRPTLLMIGNETDGLSRGLKEQSDVLATIPMDGGSSRVLPERRLRRDGAVLRGGAAAGHGRAGISRTARRKEHGSEGFGDHGRALRQGYGAVFGDAGHGASGGCASWMRTTGTEAFTRSPMRCRRK